MDTNELLIELDTILNYYHCLFKGTGMRTEWFSLSNIYLIIYALAWVWLFFYHKKKVSSFGAGSFLILLYVFFSLTSIVLFNRQEYVIGKSQGWEEVYLLPLVYLFLALWYTSTPILNYDKAKVNAIVPPNNILLYIIAIAIVVPSIWSMMTRWEYIVDGLAMILLNVDSAADLYADKVDIYDNLSNDLQTANIVVLLLHYLYTLFHDFNVLFFFYFLIVKKSKIIVFLLGVGTFFEILFSISTGNRTDIFLPVLTIITTYLALSKFFSKDIKRIVLILSTVVGAVIVIFFTIITVSRFNDLSSGTQGSVVFYAGQATLNFDVYGFDNGGIRNGDRTMMLFKGWFDEKTPSNHEDLRTKYPTLKIDDGLFSTYIGDIMLDFGPLVSTMIFLMFTLIMNKILRPQKGGYLYFDQIIPLYFIICVCSRGCMHLFDFSLKGGNWRIVGFMLIYMIFRFTRERKQVRIINKSEYAS